MLHFLSLQQIEFSYTVFCSCAHAALHCPVIYVYFEICSFRASATVSIRPDYQPAAQPTAAGYAASCPAISRVNLQLALQPTGIPAEEWIAIRFAYLFVPDGPLRMKWSLQSSVREGAAAGSLTSTLSLGLRLEPEQPFRSGFSDFQQFGPVFRCLVERKNFEEVCGKLFRRKRLLSGPYHFRSRR